MDMIGGIHKHGRTKSDSRNLHQHLIKDADKIEIMNSVAETLDSFMSDLEIMRDATKADAAFYHIFLSPSSNMTDDQLRSAAQTVVQHFDADENPYAIIYHDKDRNEGGGDRHIHIVVGRVSSDLKVLENKFEKIRLETAVRICEYEAGEPPVFGRHYKSGMKWLNEHRPEVSEWLRNHFDENGDKPQSMLSPEKRQKLERVGISLPDIKQSVFGAFSSAADAYDFINILNKSGLSLIKGDKDGVYIVRQGDIEIGALDRILKKKRKDIALVFERINFKEKINNDPTISNGSTCKSNLSESRFSRENSEPAVGSIGSRHISGTERKSTSEPPRDFRDASELKPPASIESGRRTQQVRRHSIHAEIKTKIALAALSKIQITSEMRVYMDDVNFTAKEIKGFRPDIFEASLTDGIKRTVGKAWQRLRDCIEMLKMCSETNFERLSKKSLQRWYDDDHTDDHHSDIDTHTYDPSRMRF